MRVVYRVFPRRKDGNGVKTKRHNKEVLQQACSCNPVGNIEEIVQNM